MFPIWPKNPTFEIRFRYIIELYIEMHFDNYILRLSNYKFCLKYFVNMINLFTSIYVHMMNDLNRHCGIVEFGSSLRWICFLINTDVLVNLCVFVIRVFNSSFWDFCKGLIDLYLFWILEIVCLVVCWLKFYLFIQLGFLQLINM